MWLVICSVAIRLTAPSPASSTPCPRRPHHDTTTAQASSTNATAVASSTLACVQFWVSTAGSANTNAAPNPDVDIHEPAYTVTTSAATRVGGTTQAAQISMSRGAARSSTAAPARKNTTTSPSRYRPEAHACGWVGGSAAGEVIAVTSV